MPPACTPGGESRCRRSSPSWPSPASWQYAWPARKTRRFRGGDRRRIRGLLRAEQAGIRQLLLLRHRRPRNRRHPFGELLRARKSRKQKHCPRRGKHEIRSTKSETNSSCKKEISETPPIPSYAPHHRGLHFLPVVARTTIGLTAKRLYFKRKPRMRRRRRRRRGVSKMPGSSSDRLTPNSPADASRRSSGSTAGGPHLPRQRKSEAVTAQASQAVRRGCGGSNGRSTRGWGGRPASTRSVTWSSRRSRNGRCGRWPGRSWTALHHRLEILLVPPAAVAEAAAPRSCGRDRAGDGDLDDRPADRRTATAWTCCTSTRSSPAPTPPPPGGRPRSPPAACSARRRSSR